MKEITRHLFDQISLPDCKKMYGCMDVIKRSYLTGECIYTFHENKGQIGVVESGSAWIERIDIDGNRIMLDHLEEGDVFGEVIAFANQYGEYFQIICEQPCIVAYLPYKKLIAPCSEACSCHQKMIENLLRIISEKAQNLSERIEIISNRTIRGKILYFLQLQATKVGSKQFEIPFSVSTLAEYLCVDRSAMTREIKKMKNEKIIEMNRRKVRMLI